jgi:tetratricopeptide (TPR) repeat protein
MIKQILSLICIGLITTTAIAEENCLVFYEAQNYQKSAQCYIQNLKKDRSFGNLSSAGISYCEQGRYKEALPYLKEAEKKAHTSSDYEIIYSWLSAAYSSIGDSIQTLEYDMKCLNLSLKSEDRENIGRAYSNLGIYFHGQKQYEKSLEYYEKALGYKEESEKSATYGNMALVYGDLNDFQKEEEIYQKSIAIDQQIGEYRPLGTHKINLGIFYLNQNPYDEALITLKESQNISHKAGDIATESYALSYLASIDYRNGQIDQAQIKVTEALRLAKQSGHSIVIKKANKTWNLVNGKQ